MQIVIYSTIYCLHWNQQLRFASSINFSSSSASSSYRLSFHFCCRKASTLPTEGPFGTPASNTWSPRTGNLGGFQSTTFSSVGRKSRYLRSSQTCRFLLVGLSEESQMRSRQSSNGSAPKSSSRWLMMKNPSSFSSLDIFARLCSAKTCISSSVYLQPGLRKIVILLVKIKKNNLFSLESDFCDLNQFLYVFHLY